MTYRIVRCFANRNIAKRTLPGMSRLSLEEAQEHCSNPETSSRTAKGAKARRITQRNGAWFDSYTEN